MIQYYPDLYLILKQLTMKIQIILTCDKYITSIEGASKSTSLLICNIFTCCRMELFAFAWLIILIPNISLDNIIEFLRSYLDTYSSTYKLPPNLPSIKLTPSLLQIEVINFSHVVEWNYLYLTFDLYLISYYIILWFFKEI